MRELTAVTESGKIEGIKSESGAAVIFKGVPYAEPPVGANRWKRPERKRPWRGVRPAKAFAPKCFQGDLTKDEFYGKEFYVGKDVPMSEDCLYLNIWTPAKESEKLPVLMWIHGGAFMHGYSSETEFDGEGFAQKGIVLVTVNYRVGAFGFFASEELAAEDPEGVGENYGIWDQLAALEWIRRNIANFGGDAGRITVAGQSAGCMSVQCLLSSKLTEGMIDGAILQSGGGIPGFKFYMSLEKRREGSKKLMDYLGCSDINEMRELSAEAVTDGEYRIDRDMSGLFWAPCADGRLLTESFAVLAENGGIPDIRYMIGSAEDEMGKGTGKLLFDSSAAFCESRLKNGCRPAYMYLFARKLPGDGAGAFHSSELWYEFETMKRCWRPFEAGDYSLSTLLSGCFADFVAGRELSGGWSPFDKDGGYMRFDLTSAMKYIDK